MMAARDKDGRFVRTPATEWWETTYEGSNGRTGVYRTLRHTAVHARLRDEFKGSTMRYDTTVPWPFGTYAEVYDPDRHGPCVEAQS